MTALLETKPAIFHCVRCQSDKPIQTNGGTGYASDSQGKRTCYSCCADVDREYMIEHGKIVLYLGDALTVTNWPGTLKFPCFHGRASRHNIGRTRLDVWFIGPNNTVWHGINIGDNQICRCKQTKAKPFVY